MTVKTIKTEENNRPIVMIITRNLQNLNNLVLCCGLLLSLIFLIQVKQIYDNRQKYNRFLGYKQFMNEISAEIVAVDSAVNKSSAYVRQLNEALSKQPNNKVHKNTSVPRIAFPT